MKQVKMLKDEIVSWGPQRLLKDTMPELPDDLAASLVGRGLASYVDRITSIKVEIEESVINEYVAAELENKTVVELKEMAQKAGITGYSTMKKAELIEALGG